jgi:hypothetical protein
MGKNTTRAKQPPAKYLPKALTDDEFVACAIELGQRLSRHLDALEKGEAGAVADVASVLRTLVVRGDGDDVIRRLCKRTHVPLPEVLVSRAAHDGPLVILSAGAMPAGPCRRRRRGRTASETHQARTRLCRRPPQKLAGKLRIVPGCDIVVGDGRALAQKSLAEIAEVVV